MKQALMIFAVVLLAVAYFANGDYGQAQWQAKAWMDPVVTQNEAHAANWAEKTFEPRTVFVSDIFGGELLMSRGLEGTEGGDWAIVPNVVGRMYDIQYKLYGANSSQQAHEFAKQYNAQYVWAPDRSIFAGYEWKAVNNTLFENQEFFETVYDDGTKIYRVK
ncbi:MAG: hypothetical protein V1811_02165 [Candidatus Micrarchaeota archaeon]